MQLVRDVRGFTLVELAIVMIIIGLLLGGVLKGQQLIDNARVTSVIADVKSFTAAYYSFHDTYGAIPGDMRNADTRLQGCAAGNANNCVAGNGNAIIGRMIGGVSGVAIGEDVSGDMENTQFWKHIALADLISGVDPTAPTNAADSNFAFGSSHPDAAFGGGWSMVYANDTGDDTYGHTLRLHRNPTGNIQNGSTGVQVLNPHQAAQIDRKLDDGRSNAGSVQGEYQGSGCDPTGDYDESTTAKNCWMLFTIE